MNKLLWVACGLTALAIAAVLVWRPVAKDPNAAATKTATTSPTESAGSDSTNPPIVLDTDLATKPADLPPLPNKPGGQTAPPPQPGRTGIVGAAAAAPGSAAVQPPETAEARRARVQAKAAQDAAKRDWLNARVSPPAAGKAVPEPVLALKLGADLGQKGIGVTDEIEIVQSIFTEFRRHHKENPVGENYEITATLTGANQKKISYLSPEHTSINKRGELCDHWGNPFWFHSQSKDLMEVVSRGPDGELHTADDVKMK